MTMRLIFILIATMFLVTACQNQPINIPVAGPEEQNQATIITQHDNDAAQNGQQQFSIGNYFQQQLPPSNIDQQQPSFGFFRATASFPEVRVALLVPLSGNYKSLGQSMLDSAQLALFYLNEPNLVLMPIDTKGTSFGAVQAASEAIGRGAQLILGPVFSKSAQAVSTIANNNQVNVISFSNDKSLADSGVFAIGFRPEQQIQRIVEYGLLQGIQDYTTVLPNNAYGAAGAETLRLTLAQNPLATILKTEIYYITRNGKPSRLRSHVYSALDSALNKKPPRDYIEDEKRYNDNPITYPRGMLVPEGGERLASILKILERYHFDPQKVKLMGSALWSQSTLPNSPLLEGAWYAASPVDRHEAFEQRFKQVYGYAPDNIASLAYDGVALSVALARMSNGQDFSREAITNPRGFMGVDGIFRLERNGLATRGLAIMEIKDGKPVVVDPAPDSFAEMQDRREQRQQQIQQTVQEEQDAMAKAEEERKAAEALEGVQQMNNVDSKTTAPLAPAKTQ